MKLKDIDGFLASILQGRGITTQYQVSFTNEALADIDEVEKNGMLMPILGALAKLAVPGRRRLSTISVT